MQKITTKIPTIKDLESILFRKLQEQFAQGMRRILKTPDEWIMDGLPAQAVHPVDSRKPSDQPGGSDGA